jgi:hypothetical protein
MSSYFSQFAIERFQPDGQSARFLFEKLGKLFRRYFVENSGSGEVRNASGATTGNGAHKRLVFFFPQSKRNGVGS